MNIEFLHCPICKQKAVEIAQNNFIRCAQHGWIQESVKEIEIPENIYMRPTQLNKVKYNN
jgi:hypothetical protein